jgi:hypothetical protein
MPIYSPIIQKVKQKTIQPMKKQIKLFVIKQQKRKNIKENKPEPIIKTPTGETKWKLQFPS